jgi:hypothetical protein
MKTVKEWLLEAKEHGYDWADKALFYADPETLDAPENCLSQSLLGSFYFDATDATSEGRGYWFAIFKDLQSKGL